MTKSPGQKHYQQSQESPSELVHPCAWLDRADSVIAAFACRHKTEDSRGSTDKPLVDKYVKNYTEAPHQCQPVRGDRIGHKELAGKLLMCTSKEVASECCLQPQSQPQ